AREIRQLCLHSSYQLENLIPNPEEVFETAFPEFAGTHGSIPDTHPEPTLENLPTDIAPNLTENKTLEAMPTDIEPQYTLQTPHPKNPAVKNPAIPINLGHQKKERKLWQIYQAILYKGWQIRKKKGMPVQGGP
ncbi:unnamed protein product, partial [Larinioides sclopetarius]